MNRGGEKRVRTGREKSLSFTKITKEIKRINNIGELIIVICIGKSMEKVFGKSSFLDLEPSTMPHAGSVSFLTSTDDRIQKYSSMFGFSWTNPSVNSQCYIKNVCPDVA